MTRPVALRPSEPVASPELGPAFVVSVGPGFLMVRLDDDREVRARLALAQPYEAREGDEVLVIGRGASHYVIGVLHGTGRSTLELPGDVHLRAVGGTLHLSGDEGVKLDAPKVSLRASQLELVAGAVVETFRSLRQRVSELVSVHAGEQHTVVDGAATTVARSASITTEKTVSINGKAVHLG